MPTTGDCYLLSVLGMRRTRFSWVKELPSVSRLGSVRLKRKSSLGIFLPASFSGSVLFLMETSVPAIRSSLEQ